MTAYLSGESDTNQDFERLVVKYQQKIYNLICRLVGDAEVATDLTKDTFISAFRHYDKFTHPSIAFTWLYVTARNLSSKYLQNKNILSVVDQLSAEYRQLIMLYYIQVLSFPEIAKVTGLNINDIDILLARARGQLRELLEPNFRMNIIYSARIIS